MFLYKEQQYSEPARAEFKLPVQQPWEQEDQVLQPRW